MNFTMRSRKKKSLKKAEECCASGGISLFVVSEPNCEQDSKKSTTYSKLVTRKFGLSTLLVKDLSFCESFALVNKAKAYPGGSLYQFHEKLHKNLFFVRETIIFTPPKVVYCFYVLELKIFSKSIKRQTAYEAVLRKAFQSLATLRDRPFI